MSGVPLQADAFFFSRTWCKSSFTLSRSRPCPPPLFSGPPPSLPLLPAPRPQPRPPLRAVRVSNRKARRRTTARVPHSLCLPLSLFLPLCYSTQHPTQHLTYLRSSLTPDCVPARPAHFTPRHLPRSRVSRSLNAPPPRLQGYLAHKNSPPLGPYSRLMPRVKGVS